MGINICRWVIKYLENFNIVTFAFCTVSVDHFATGFDRLGLINHYKSQFIVQIAQLSHTKLIHFEYDGSTCKCCYYSIFDRHDGAGWRFWDKVISLDCHPQSEFCFYADEFSLDSVNTLNYYKEFSWEGVRVDNIRFTTVACY